MIQYYSRVIDTYDRAARFLDPMSTHTDSAARPVKLLTIAFGQIGFISQKNGTTVALVGNNIDNAYAAGVQHETGK